VGTAGDVNGDGYADVLVLNFSDDFFTGLPSRAHLYLGTPGGAATTPAWTTLASDDLTMGVSTAGDVNGDGYSDVIVGEPWYLNKGRARVFHGSAAGLSTTANWTFETAGANARLGWAVGTAGDVNGDGFADVLVGSPNQSSSGYVVGFHGSATGLHTVPDFAWPSLISGADLGYSVATAGDVNGDGYSDVIVGAPRHDSPETDEGRAFVFLGSASGLLTPPVWAAESNQAGAELGHAVAPAGDINGDGYADVVIGAHRYNAGLSAQGRAYVHFGSSSGLIPASGWTQNGPVTNGLYASSLGTAGDVNGDGFADVIVGGEGSGRADIFLGSASGLDLSPLWQRETDQAGATFGVSVAGTGDVDGDGYGDILVGAHNYDNGEANEGKVFLYRGSSQGTETVPAWSVEGGLPDAQLGYCVASAGDVNGDGYADAVVGAPGWSNGEASEGRALVYLGSPAGLATSAGWAVESGILNARYGQVVASAGDVNGDGFDEVLVGAPFLDHELTDEGRADLYLGSPTGPAATPAWSVEGDQPSVYLGWSVGTAGDTNRDGFADVILGVPLASNGQSREGQARLYLGSAGGLASSPAWTAESNQTDGFLGRSVSTAGDVNGDGYADAIVGGDGYGNGQVGEGRAWLYLGVPSGLAILPVWSAESDQAGAHFGTTVSTAGDVNGDGFADVIVGAVDYDGPAGTNAGRAYLFQGNPNGLSLVPRWTADGHEPSGFLGWAVAAAGDVNGDGYADVVAGEPLADGLAGLDGGRAFVFQGGSHGLSMRPRQRTTGGSPVDRGGTVGSADSFGIDLLGRTPFGRGKVRLEWEVKPLGAVFDGTGTQVAAAAMDCGVTGASLVQTVSGLSPSTAYHWRARLRYDATTTPFVQRSRWVTVPWGGWNETMLRTTAAAPVAAGRSGAIELVRAGGGLTMVWTGNGSCNAADSDHAIYEGTLGDFTSHVPVTCSTGPFHTWNFTPQPGNRYFLLVPINSTREGSLGLGAGGAERPQSLAACRPQLIACP
ncbi:MAG TPA: FG-GAP-like repeat-containing protein, partial [Candidatus Polarisedimenticolaceae bacterium]|nr:FG-GAP-like repeat-containing protein [Candidatus Polarisedimenticolaceae bacterium]